MKLKHKVNTAITAVAIGFLGFFVSCEDKNSTNCNCDDIAIDYIVPAESLDSTLSQLSANSTIVVIGKNLSSISSAYFVDSIGTTYSIDLNPAFVANNSIIISLGTTAQYERTEILRLISQNGCVKDVNILKSPASPSIKQFYSEFVPDGDTLRIYGSAFLSTDEFPLKVWFFSEGGDTIWPDSYVIGKNLDELLVPVPTGVGNSTPVGVKTKFGSTLSSMLFRDSRNLFLDFDVIIPGGQHGSLDTFSYDWDPALKTSSSASIYEQIKPLVGDIKSCNGYYGVLSSTKSTWSNTDEMFYYTPYSSSKEAAPRNLLGVFEQESLNNLLLKFEVYVPKNLPLATWFSIIFSGYGSEDGEKCVENYGRGNGCSYFPRDLTAYSNYDSSNEVFVSCTNNAGVPAAFLNMCSYSVTNETDSPVISFSEGFYTNHGWMTVTVPLTSFVYSRSGFGLTSNDQIRSCATLETSDFFNFFFQADGDALAYQAQSNSSIGQSSISDYFFCAFDNFRIVPNDNGGVRFSKFKGATVNTKYPY